MPDYVDGPDERLREVQVARVHGATIPPPARVIVSSADAARARRGGERMKTKTKVRAGWDLLGW